MNQSLAIEATSFPATSLQVAVNAPGRDQLTPLMLAVLNSKEQVVPALLAAGADPNTAEQGGSTALFYASGQEDVDIVHSLLQAGASCSLANPNGQLPVHFACQIGSLPVLQALAAHGSSVVAADASGYTPLHYACKFGRQEVARWLLASGARSILEARAEGGVTPLLQSAEEKQFHLIPMLLEEGANPAAMDTTFWQPLHYVALSSDPGAVEAAKALLQAGAPINHQNQQYGSTALLFGCIEDILVPELLSRGMAAHINTPDITGLTPLIAAASKQPHLVPLLLQHGADPGATDGQWGRTALYLAAGSSDPAAVDAVRRLLDQGAQIDCRNLLGQTPLHIASEFGNIAVVRLLLERGHPVNVFAYEEPRTPLHMAVLEGHTEVVDLLLQHGASFAGAPLVHVAAEVGDPALVRSLLAAPEGCGQVAALDQFHACPLHWAAKHGHLEVAQALVQADPAAAATSCDVHGFADRFGFDQLTPIDWALTNADRPMARLLIRTGGGSSGEVLQALHTAFALATDEAEQVEVEALFTDVVASRPLSEEEWASVPNQVPGLDSALPAVLARSRTEAAHLVRHLQQEEQELLQATVLSLSHACRRAKVELPFDVLPTLLAAVFGTV
ncbi:hypothetical protein COHA_000783 [Chlorella ohadii]|uniref:Uncharacterized protein n=1 Tax=Chlorella ohadii TaxID=2649997 RepID=A0AAD5E2N8_9CHLO|nr:hypothetical protein COHA_000783 [Chlorella ohadii]